MDEHAKDERTNGEVCYDEPYTGSGAMLIINGEWVTNNYAARIKEAVMIPHHLKWFRKKSKDKTEDDYNSINWAGIGNARKKLNNSDNVHLVKFMNRWLNTGRQKRLHGKDPSCPARGIAEETQLHIL